MSNNDVTTVTKVASVLKNLQEVEEILNNSSSSLEDLTGASILLKSVREKLSNKIGSLQIKVEKCLTDTYIKQTMYQPTLFENLEGSCNIVAETKTVYAIDIQGIRKDALPQITGVNYTDSAYSKIFKPQVVCSKAAVIEAYNNNTLPNADRVKIYQHQQVVAFTEVKKGGKN